MAPINQAVMVKAAAEVAKNTPAPDCLEKYGIRFCSDDPKFTGREHFDIYKASMLSSEYDFDFDVRGVCTSMFKVFVATVALMVLCQLALDGVRLFGRKVASCFSGSESTDNDATKTNANIATDLDTNEKLKLIDADTANTAITTNDNDISLASETHALVLQLVTDIADHPRHRDRDPRPRARPPEGERDEEIRPLLQPANRGSEGRSL